MRKGIGGHQSAAMDKDEWLTPPFIVNCLGSFDLDPCSPVVRPWDTAAHHFTVSDDGLSKMWFGRVWMNPPYGKNTSLWLEKLSKHGNGIALIFARTETEMFFQHVWPKCNAILFIKGRLHFHHADGIRAEANSGAPSVLIAYGSENVRSLQNSGINGQLVILR